MKESEMKFADLTERFAAEVPAMTSPEITIDEVVEFICASVANIGYPVGMGIRPNQDSMKLAAIKLKALMDASYSDGYGDAMALKETRP
jgi:hypothetical protein